MGEEIQSGPSSSHFISNCPMETIDKESVAEKKAGSTILPPTE